MAIKLKNYWRKSNFVKLWMERRWLKGHQIKQKKLKDRKELKISKEVNKLFSISLQQFREYDKYGVKKTNPGMIFVNSHENCWGISTGPGRDNCTFPKKKIIENDWYVYYWLPVEIDTESHQRPEKDVNLVFRRWVSSLWSECNKETKLKFTWWIV